MSEVALVLKELKQIREDITFLKTLINFNVGAAIQAKWVSDDEAMAITGLKKSALMDRQVTTNRKGEANPMGIFRISKTGKKIRFYRDDLEKFVKTNSSL